MTAVREVLLVRHGEAHCNVAGLIASVTCTGLTKVGGHQADQLARRLLVEHSAGQPITRLHTSSVLRARETALAIAALTGAEPVIQRDLRVPNPGLADGQPWDAVRRRFGPDPDRPTRPLIPDGESWRQYLKRAQGCLADIIVNHPGGRVVIVGHSETVTAAFTLLIQARALGALRVDLHHTGITRLVASCERPDVRVDGQRWALNVHNDTAHLDHRFGSTRTYSA